MTVASAANCFLRPPAHIILCGPYGCGKSTFVAQLAGESVHLRHYPTVGLKISQFKHFNRTYRIWELGGRQEVARNWATYLAGCSLIIFMVDSSDHKTITPAGNQLRELLENPATDGIPLLILANKQDAWNALHPNTISMMMVLHQRLLEPGNKRQWKIEGISAYNNEEDEVQECMAWCIGDQLEAEMESLMPTVENKMRNKVQELKERKKFVREWIMREFDADGDGKISFEELKVGMGKAKREWAIYAAAKKAEKKRELDELREMLDTDGDGKISRAEMFAGMRKLKEAKMKQLADIRKLAISLADEDGDGKISRQEMMNAMKRAGAIVKERAEKARAAAKAAHAEMMAELDKDGDGKVTKEEIEAYKRRRRAKQVAAARAALAKKKRHEKRLAKKRLKKRRLRHPNDTSSDSDETEMSDVSDVSTTGDEGSSDGSSDDDSDDNVGSDSDDDNDSGSGDSDNGRSDDEGWGDDSDDGETKSDAGNDSDSSAAAAVEIGNASESHDDSSDSETKEGTDSD